MHREDAHQVVDREDDDRPELDAEEGRLLLGVAHVLCSTVVCVCVLVRLREGTSDVR